MYNRIISYDDLDGNPIKDEFHFYLNKVEALEFAALYKGTPGKVVTQAFEGMRAGDEEGEHESVILKFFRVLVASSVGRRSENGKSFFKNDTLTNEFMQSDAYSNFFFELMKDEQLAMEFFKKVFPKEMSEQLITAGTAKMTSYTDEQLVNMSDVEFDRVAGKDPQNMTREHLMIAMKRKNIRMPV